MNLSVSLLLVGIFALGHSIGYDRDQDKIPSDSDTIAVDNPLRTLTVQESLMPHLPTSPQAEAFQRVGDYSVNNSSGMPDISIPLYEINHCGYKIPLALRYIATPLKPGYNYDVVGKGWALSPSACITRNIASAADEDTDFKLSTQIFNEYFNDYENSLNDFNFQHDKFNVTLPDGASFFFYMCRDEGQNIRYYISDRHPWKITYGVSGSGISNFTLTDEHGIKYYFNDADRAVWPAFSKNVAWYLSKIELPNSTSPINFSYSLSIKQDNEQINNPVLSLARYYSYNPISGQAVEIKRDNGTPNSNYKMRLLTSISFGPTVLQFAYQNSTDESPYNYLSSINITDGSVPFKIFQFNYTFKDTWAHPVADLTSLTLSGANQQESPQVYKFTYSGMNQLSGVTTTDHWGYRSFDNSLNTANFNFFVEFDSTYNYNILQSGLFKLLQKTSQEPSLYQKFKLQNSTADSRLGVDAYYHDYLTSITYPTGGKTTFEFETHRFVTATSAQGDYITTKRQRRVVQGGGMRIKKIRNYTADGALADTKSYFYGPTYQEVNAQNLNYPECEGITSKNHIGFGEPVVDPNLLTYLRFNNSPQIPSSVRNMLLGQNSQGEIVLNTNPFRPYSYNWQWECKFSSLYFRGLLGGRNAVVYPVITEYHGDVDNLDAASLNITGKIVYNYNIYDYGDSVYLEPLQYYGHVLDCRENPAKRDWLTEKTTYGYDGTDYNLYQKEVYSYQTTGTNTLHGYNFKEEYPPGYVMPYYTVAQSVDQKYSVLGNRQLSGSTNYIHTSTGTLSRTTSYTYNIKDQLTSTSYTNPSRTITYTYPQEGESAPEIEQQMIARNMLSAIMEYKENNDGYKKDYASYSFGNETLLLPSKLYRLASTLSSQEFEEDHRVLSYTANGNPLEVVDRSGIHTCYLWSYHDRYLVAEIRNDSLSHVNTVLQTVFGTDASGLAALASPSSAGLDNLRTSSQLTNCMITTWTYRPLVGVTSSTDPSGVSTYYDYDGLGRLKEIYQYEGNVVSPNNKRVLKQYTYHTSTSE